MGVRTAICAIAKNERYYLNDWIGYHIRLGFDHIYIYDNEDLDSGVDIRDYIDYKFNDKVTILDARGKLGYQTNAYNEFWGKYRHLYDWIICLDVDEFVTIVDSTKSIEDVLSNEGYKDFIGIRLNWVFYSDNNQLWGDLNIPVYERFCEEKTPNRCGEIFCTKTFVNTGCDQIKIGIHQPYGLKWEVLGNFCHPNLQKAIPLKGRERWCVQQIERTIMYIRHFPTKTVSEFKIQKLCRSNASNINDKRTNNYDYMWWFNDKTDEKILFLDTISNDEISAKLESNWVSKPTNTLFNGGLK